MSKRGPPKLGAASAADCTTVDSAVSSTSTTHPDSGANTDSAHSTATASLPEGEVSSTSLETPACPAAPWDVPDKNPFVGMSEEALSQIAAALSTEEGKKFLENIGDPLEGETQKSLSSSGGLDDVLTTPSSMKLVELDHKTVEATLTATETQGFDLDEEMTSKILQEGLREGDLVEFATSFSDHAYAINPERTGGARKSNRIAARHGDAETARPGDQDKEEDGLTKTESAEEGVASTSQPSPATSSKSGKSPRREESILAHVRRSSRITDKEQRTQADKIRQENQAKEREARAALTRGQEPPDPQTPEKKDAKKLYNMRTRTSPGCEAAHRGGRGRRRGGGVGRGKHPDTTLLPGESPGDSAPEQEDVPLTRVQKQIREDDQDMPEESEDKSEPPEPSTSPETEPSKKGGRKPGRRKKMPEAVAEGSPEGANRDGEKVLKKEEKAAKKKATKQAKGKKAGADSDPEDKGKDSSTEASTQEDCTPKRKGRNKKSAQNITEGDQEKQIKKVKKKKVSSEAAEQSDSEPVEDKASEDETVKSANKKSARLKKSVAQKLTKTKKKKVPTATLR